MHDDKYLVTYSFLPRGSPISFHLQKEWQLPKGCSMISFYCCNSFCGPAHLANSGLRLNCYLSYWFMYGAHDRCMGASLQHEKNSLQSAPVRLGEYYFCFTLGHLEEIIIWRGFSLSTARERAYVTSITSNSLTLGEIYWSDQHHCANSVMQMIERSSSSPGQHETLYRRDKLLSSNCLHLHSACSSTSAARQVSPLQSSSLSFTTHQHQQSGSLVDEELILPLCLLIVFTVKPSEL